MTEISEAKILRLQKNLPIIRNLAGWTAEDLGGRIGVTRQTITNMEKSATLAMTKTQYIAIRAVLDYQIEESNNSALANAITVLVDAENLTADQTKKIDDAIASITRLKSRRVNDKTVLEGITGLISAIGVIGGITLSTALKKTTSVPKWLSEILK